jgi:hypothetical protein
MAWVARAFGVLLIAFGLLGAFSVWVGQSQDYPMPLWNDAAWSGEARRIADWATYAALAVGGLSLILRHGAAAWLLGVALFAAAGRTVYDLAFGEAGTARGEVMLQGDLIASSAAVAGLVVFLLAARRRGTSTSGVAGD